MHLLSNLGVELAGKVGLYEAWQLPLTLLALVSGVLIMKYPLGLFAKFETVVGRIADRPYLSAALIAGAAACARLALSPILGIPQPIVPDEISLMLQAKTYLTGHLANHVNLLPDFESIYVLLSPTYASMYPVLRSFPMFIGFSLGIGAWGGVLLSMVALTVAVYWMVREWINPRYAFIASLIIIIRYGLFSFWVNSYWGGAFTALGGVLLLGGFKAVRSRPTLFNGAVVGLGVFILMTTRPYEGMLFSIPFGVALIIQFLRATTLARRPLIPAGLAAAVLVVAGFGLTFAENQAVTGDWKVSPYILYAQKNGHVPFLLVDSHDTHLESHARYFINRHVIDSWVASYYRRQTAAGTLAAEALRLRNYWNFYVGFALFIPFVLGIYALRGEPTLLVAAGSLAIGLSLESFDFAHYAAPGFGLVMLAIMGGFTSLRQWRPWGHPYGLSLSRTLPLAVVLGSVVPLADLRTVARHASVRAPCCWLGMRSLHTAVENEVDSYEGENLLIVDTSSKSRADVFLVSNDPDIDHEKTIWINEDAELNRLEIDRYPNRRVWRLGWLDDHAACLQLSQNVSSPANALPDIGRHSGEQKQGWVPGSPDRCPGGLVQPQFVELD